MTRLRKSLGAVVSLTVALLASAPAAEGRRFVTDDEAARWSGVGLLRIGGGSCTGTLIGPDLVLTAAHCVLNKREGSPIDPKLVEFRAGWKDGVAVESRQARSIRVHPGYLSAQRAYTEGQIRSDVATVRLEEPVTKAPAYAIAQTPRVGADVALVSYSQGRLFRLSVQAPCEIRARRTEFMEFACVSEPGASGAPIFRVDGGAPTIVALNTGTRRGAVSPTALGLTLDHVRGFIGSTGLAAAPAAGAVTGITRSGVSGLPGASRAGEGLKRFKP